MRPDLPAQPTFRTGSIGATFGNDEYLYSYQIYDRIEAKVAVIFWNGDRLHDEEEAFEDGSQSGNEYIERETFAKRREFQSFSGTKAEREAVGRGDTAAKQQASCSCALRSIDEWRVRREDREEGRKICNG